MSFDAELWDEIVTYGEDFDVFEQLCVVDHEPPLTGVHATVAKVHLLHVSPVMLDKLLHGNIHMLVICYDINKKLLKLNASSLYPMESLKAYLKLSESLLYRV